MPSRALILTIAILSLLTWPVVAQSLAKETSDTYLREFFEKSNIPLPQLGWIVPSGELITELSAPSLIVLSDRPAIVTARMVSALPASEIKDFVKRHQVDCDQTTDDSRIPLYRYQTGLPPQKNVKQVMVIGHTSADTKAQSSRLSTYIPTTSEQAPAWKALLAGPIGHHVSRSIAVPNSPLFYTLAATYNRKGIILRSGIFLQDHSGNILGQEIQNIQGQNQCDGCGVPTETDGIDAVYDVENLLTLPGLAYPALLINSSTAEGRAIELFTFSQAGEPSRFRLYEYMVTCILGSSEEQAKPK